MNERNRPLVLKFQLAPSEAGVVIDAAHAKGLPFQITGKLLEVALADPMDAYRLGCEVSRRLMKRSRKR